MAVKNSQAIQIPDTVHIPVFGRERRCFKAKYQIVAAVIHHGSNTLSGHYTAVLWNPSDREHCWETNDNRVMRARASPPSAMLRNCYLSDCSYQVAGKHFMGRWADFSLRMKKKK